MKTYKCNSNNQSIRMAQRALESAFHDLFSIEGHTMNVKWYFPLTEGCLEYFP